jgi:hypothetical protein
MATMMVTTIPQSQPSAQSLLHDQQSSGSMGQAGIAIRQDSGGEK